MSFERDAWLSKSSGSRPNIKALVYGIKTAARDAGQTLDTFALVNIGGLFLFPLYGLGRTGLKTEAAFFALILIHFELKQGGAAFCRAPFFKDMGLVLIPKVSYGGENGVRRRLTEAA